MTGNVTTSVLALLTLFGPGLWSHEEAVAKLRRTLPLVIGFFVGCAIGAAAATHLGPWAWTLPALLDHEHDPPVRRSLAGGSPFAWNRSSGYRQTLLQAPGSTPFPSSFAASVQESLLTASMQSLAAPLSNLVPAGQVTWAQPMEFWSSLVQEPL